MTAITNSSLAFYRRSQAQMGDLRAQAENLQGQLSSGERLARSSDDPAAASRLRLLGRMEQLATIDAENARRTAEDLDLAGSALESIGADLIRARELAIWAGSNTLGDEQRRAIADEIDQLRQNILALANSPGSSGDPLFGGQSDSAPYVTDASGAIVYTGTAQADVIDLGPGQSVVRGLTGPEFLAFTVGGTPTDAFAYFATLAETIRTAADPATAARDALGGLDSALDTLTRAQTIAGARIAWLDVVQERQLDQSLTRNQQIADTGGVEFASTIAELQQMLTVLEASQASFARLSNLSLFNQI
ncbi:flagellin N-terminal helical domain-containing protein [Erythrobacter sp. EC-HK427]|uniref:flagellin N-terminal helical domain-containing protein n=1 Tax=Erythrobacter sp. EC-HK427 TaxID=2038396 RepID=UPI0012593F7F|nr:flagellar biosynthesis protein FlgL [Erythrobacter sp. EC-HK427]VVT01614.1 conserved hypothetical protein [Erythrobacter sp. EC-HK427]